MHGFAAALPCSYLCSEAAACGMYIECPFLCKMLWCLKQCGLKVIFRKFFIHRHLPSLTGTGNVLHPLHLRPPWFKIILLHIFSHASPLLSTSCLPDLVLWKEKFSSWHFILCSSAASLLSNPFYSLHVRAQWAGTASPPSLSFAIF